MIGIMQGRLVPPVGGTIQCFPRERWRDEFALAAAAGLDAIEWIYDLSGMGVNPIATDEGLAEIAALSAQSRVQVRSLCADYFMDRPLLRADEGVLEDRAQTLAWLLERCAMLGAGRLVLPFVEASEIDSDADLDTVVSVLGRVLGTVEATNVEVHLETSLSPDRFAEMLARLPHQAIKVNYDSGNSASLGYDPTTEFAAYGDRVGGVHIKDRVKGGVTVPLGTGDADLFAVFDCLRDMAYAGDFVLQVARGVDGDEVNWAKQNRTYVTALQAARA